MNNDSIDEPWTQNKYVENRETFLSNFTFPSSQMHNKRDKCERCL